MNLREYEPLHRHTTLRTGGPARFFAEVHTEDEVREALAFARRRALPIFVLGGGSNVLASDTGFDGLVLKMANRGVRLEAGESAEVEVIAEAGEGWDELVAFTVQRNLRGLENLSLIPGQVGGAVVGNIGAYGVEVKDTLRWVETLDTATGKLRQWPASACALGYRASVFKTGPGRRFIVLRAAFALQQAGGLNLTYRELHDYLVAQGKTAPTLAEVRAAVIALRRRKLPDVTQVGTAGSFFKNPVIPRAQYAALAARFPNLPAYEAGEGTVKVPLGWILDHVCGLKGVRRGRVGTHARQALVIVNDGGTAAEVERLAEELAAAVRAKTGLTVEWEVEKLGGAA